MDMMTPKERMIAALGNKQPDRVPVAPDISNMIPCRLTGKPFWEIYVNQNPPLWKAYIEAVKYYGIDGWFTYGDLQYKQKSQICMDSHFIRKSHERWDVKYIHHTPDGDLTEVLANPVDNPPTRVEKLVKDFKEDFKKLYHFFTEPVSYDPELYKQQKKELGDLGIMSVGIFPPGLTMYTEYFNGSLEAAVYAMIDYPDLFDELCELHDRQCVKMTEMAIDAGVESVLTGGSGSITLQSPELWRKLALPSLKKITKMCREAGIISGIHSCGKEMYLVETCANETDLDYVNPLEIPAMGDCDLAECKERFGDKLALMGNLHTTSVMLRGSCEDVRRESIKAILAAGGQGGFVLSTGDQCGRDTPDGNIFTMVEAAKEYGQYPLDLGKLRGALI